MRENTIEVFLNEDHGYRTYIWHPNMTEYEFSLWWSDQSDTDIIGYYFNINKLPGTLAPFKERKNIKVAPGIMQREENDPKSWTPQLYAHINDVDDSYIEIGTNRISRRYTQRRGSWKDLWSDWQMKKQARLEMNKNVRY